MEAHEWKAERIRQDLPFLERHHARLRHQIVQALRQLVEEGEALAFELEPFMRFVAVVSDRLLDTFREVYPRAARTALDIAMQSVRFARDPQLPDSLRRWYQALVSRFLTEYSEREQRAIRALVERAYLQGLDARQVARQVAERMQRVAGWQAERIARTELMRFYNLAHYSVYRTFATIVAYEYSVVLDDRTSHICRPLVGLRIAAHQLRHLPPFHPHCRTVLLPIFEGEQQEEGVSYTDPSLLSIPPGWGNLEGLPLPQPTRLEPVPPTSRVRRRVPPEPVQQAPSVLRFPEPDESLESVEPLGGSTGAELVRDPRGQLWVRKYGRVPEQVLHEHLAHELYRAVGISAPASRVYLDAQGRPYLLSEYIADARLISDLAGDALQEARAALQRGFVMDVLLENYDVVGLVGDNILVRRDGTVVRVDNGGSFSRRAQGELKSYTPSLQSLWSLRGRPLLNGQVYQTAATEVFGEIGLDALLGQMGEVLARREAIEAVLARFESELPAGVSRSALEEVRANMRVLRERLRLLELLRAGLEDMRADFVDDYVERWGQFYEALISDGAPVLEEVVERYRGVLDVASRAEFLSDVGDEVIRVREANVEQLWGVYTRRGVEDVERVRAAADRMVEQHAWHTRYNYAYVMRQLANRFMRRFEVAEYEYPRFLGQSIESIIAEDAERSGLDVSHYERGFMALHAMSYGVLRRLCAEPPSPVFRVDGTIRVARVLTDDAELRGESSFRVLATGSSPYRVFSVARLWALGVARVPVRRVLTNVLLNEKLHYSESEHLLMGGQRWRLVFGKEMAGEMEQVLRKVDSHEIQLRVMHLWDELDDEALDGALWQLWRELRAAHERQ